jgi:hypothetical protein
VQEDKIGRRCVTHGRKEGCVTRKTERLWKDKIKMDLMVWDGVIYIGFIMFRTGINGNGVSGFVNLWEILELLSDSWLLMKESSPWS